jgi:hypothetical protein
LKKNVIFINDYITQISYIYGSKTKYFNTNLRVLKRFIKFLLKLICLFKIANVLANSMNNKPMKNGLKKKALQAATNNHFQDSSNLQSNNQAAAAAAAAALQSYQQLLSNTQNMVAKSLVNNGVNAPIVNGTGPGTPNGKYRSMYGNMPDAEDENNRGSQPPNGQPRYEDEDEEYDMKGENMNYDDEEMMNPANPSNMTFNGSNAKKLVAAYTASVRSLNTTPLSQVRTRSLLIKPKFPIFIF